MRLAHRVRLAAVLVLGAFALHQLRYLIAFGGSSSSELARQGHGYMADALPLIGVFALSAVLATLIRGRFGAGLVRATLPRRAAVLGFALLAIFATQESLEGTLAAGHPGGIAAVLAAGGWLAVPLAFILGAVAALVLRLLERVELVFSGDRARSRFVRAPRVQGRPLATVRLNPLISSLAFGLARRPPPPVPA